MIPYIYVSLLSLMLFVLYLSGKTLRRDYRILSISGVVSLLVYTLNEGLRFGRGIDYMVYGSLYEDVSVGIDIEKDILFTMLTRVLVYCGLPFQSEVILLSFLFILATLFLFRNYKEIVPLALPFFVLLSLRQVENMVRWYMGYSFILIGLSFLLQGGKKNLILYILFSLIAIFSHYGLFFIPVFFYLVFLRKSPFFPPIVTICLFLSIYFFFKTDWMLSLVEYVNIFNVLNDASKHYTDNIEYWLTGGFAGMGSSDTSIGITEFVVFAILVIEGYNFLKIHQSKNLTFAYNLFIIGLLLYPISKHIELVIRYRSIFLFFEAIVLSYIVYYYKRKIFRLNSLIVANKVIIVVAALFFVKYYSESFTVPFKSGSYRYMYVWDKANLTYDSMINMYHDDMYKARSRSKK